MFSLECLPRAVATRNGSTSKLATRLDPEGLCFLCSVQSACLPVISLTALRRFEGGRGASIYDVRIEGGGGVCPKEDVVREVA